MELAITPNPMGLLDHIQTLESYPGVLTPEPRQMFDLGFSELKGSEIMGLNWLPSNEIYSFTDGYFL